MKSFTGRTGKDVTKSKFKKYKKNQAGSFQIFGDPETSIKMFNASLGDATGAGCSGGESAAGGCACGEALEEANFNQADIGYDTDSWEAGEQDFEEREDAMEELRKIESLEYALDNELDWYIQDELCGHPEVEKDVIVIRCDSEPTVRTEILDVIRDIAEEHNATAEVDPATDEIVITFNDDTCNEGYICIPEEEDAYEDICTYGPDMDDEICIAKVDFEPEKLHCNREVDPDFDMMDEIDPCMLKDIRDYYIDNDIDICDEDHYDDDCFFDQSPKLKVYTITFSHGNDPFTGIMNAFSPDDAGTKFAKFCPSCRIGKVIDGVACYDYPYITRDFESDMGWLGENLNEDDTKKLSYDQKQAIKKAADLGDTEGAAAISNQAAIENNPEKLRKAERDGLMPSSSTETKTETKPEVNIEAELSESFKCPAHKTESVSVGRRLHLNEKQFDGTSGTATKNAIAPSSTDIKVQKQINAANKYPQSVTTGNTNSTGLISSGIKAISNIDVKKNVSNYLKDADLSVNPSPETVAHNNAKVEKGKELANIALDSNTSVDDKIEKASDFGATVGLPYAAGAPVYGTAAKSGITSTNIVKTTKDLTKTTANAVKDVATSTKTAAEAGQAVGTAASAANKALKWNPAVGQAAGLAVDTAGVLTTGEGGSYLDGYSELQAKNSDKKNTSAAVSGIIGATGQAGVSGTLGTIAGAAVGLPLTGLLAGTTHGAVTGYNDGTEIADSSNATTASNLAKRVGDATGPIAGAAVGGAFGGWLGGMAGGKFGQYTGAEGAAAPVKMITNLTDRVKNGTFKSTSDTIKEIKDKDVAGKAVSELTSSSKSQSTVKDSTGGEQHSGSGAKF